MAVTGAVIKCNSLSIEEAVILLKNLSKQDITALEREALGMAVNALIDREARS